MAAPSKDGIDPEVFELYKDLLEQQNTNHNVYVITIIGILTVAIGLTFWWNYQGARAYIRKRIKKERAEIQNEILKKISVDIANSIKEEVKDIDQRFNALEGNIARSMAGVNTSHGHKPVAIHWWLTAISIYTKENTPFAEDLTLRICKSIKSLIDEIERLESEQNRKSLVVNKDSSLEVIGALPNTLNDYKRKFKAFFKARESFED